MCQDIVSTPRAESDGRVIEDYGRGEADSLVELGHLGLEVCIGCSVA